MIVWQLSFLFLAIFEFAQPSEACQQAQSCGECQRISPDCVWCLDPGFTGAHRCGFAQQLELLGCPAESIFSLKPTVTLTKDFEFGRPKNEPPNGVYQIRPQMVEMFVVPGGEKLTFTLHYKHTSNRTSDIFVMNSAVEPLGIRISYIVHCKRVTEASNFCSGVHSNEQVSFDVTVELLGSCENPGLEESYISLAIGGVRDVTMLVVHPLCGCPCEGRELQEVQSVKCDRNGNLVCGRCKCHSGFAGAQCECRTPTNAVSYAAGYELDAHCVHNGEVCSNNGQCICGTCQCSRPTLSGLYCQCDNTTCAIEGGSMCSGHGRCDCGLCTCERGWSGAACGCSTTTELCVAENGQVCGGRGACECGRCICATGFAGPTCDRCVACDADQSVEDVTIVTGETFVVAEELITPSTVALRPPPPPMPPILTTMTPVGTSQQEAPTTTRRSPQKTQKAAKERLEKPADASHRKSETTAAQQHYSNSAALAAYYDSFAFAIVLYQLFV